MPTTVGELNAILRLDKRDFDSGIGAAEGRFSRFGSTAKTLAKGVALGAGAAVVGAAVAGTKALLDFDTGMREVFTLMPGITDQARTAMQEDVSWRSQNLRGLPPARFCLLSIRRLAKGCLPKTYSTLWRSQARLLLVVPSNWKLL